MLSLSLCQRPESVSGTTMRKNMNVIMTSIAMAPSPLVTHQLRLFLCASCSWGCLLFCCLCFFYIFVLLSLYIYIYISLSLSPSLAPTPKGVGGNCHRLACDSMSTNSPKVGFSKASATMAATKYVKQLLLKFKGNPSFVCCSNIQTRSTSKLPN